MSEDVSSLLEGTLDCGALLEFVTIAEHCVAATTSFGHPDPPHLCLHHDICDLTNKNKNNKNQSGKPTAAGRRYVMMVAYTKHVVAAQLVTTTADESSPIPGGAGNNNNNNRATPGPLHVAAIPTFAPDGMDDQRITCLQIVPLKASSSGQKCTKARDDKKEKSTGVASLFLDDGANDVTKSDDNDTDASTTDSFITNSEASAAVKDAAAGNNVSAVSSAADMPPLSSRLVAANVDDDDDHRVAVVFGTNTNQVFTVELTIVLGGEAPSLAHVHIRDHDNTLYQVFPPDSDEDGGGQHGDALSPFQFQKRRRKGSPSSTKGKRDDPAKQRHVVPFQPWGGVTSIEVHPNTANAGTIDNSTSSSHGWLMYGDGTMLRVATGAFFPSQWSQAVGQRLSVEDYLTSTRGDDRPLVRCQVKLPTGPGGVVVYPLPRYHASPLAFPLPPHLLTQGAKHVGPSSGRFREEFEALAFARDGNDLFPAVCFYSSECQSETAVAPLVEKKETVEKKDGGESGKTAGKSIAQSFVGSAFGALKRTLLFSGGGRSEATPTETEVTDKMDSTSARGDIADGSNDADLPSSPFPSLLQRPVSLFANGELHDAPRKIETCTIDPDGKLAATCDSLGRVLLIDVATKQTIRMWKGCRDASCYWMHRLVEPDRTDSLDDQGSDAWRHSSAISKTKLYLVIHARQRRTIEVWRLRQGRRVHAVQVGRIARVVSFSYWSSAASRILHGCYVIKSLSSSDASRSKQLELLTVSDEGSDLWAAAENASVSMSVASSIRSPMPSTGNVRRAAQRLQHLQQLLSSADAVQFSLDDVRAALHEIESLADLASALDLLSVGKVLEERLGVIGASFQNDAIVHCRAVLNAALHRGKMRNDMTATNPSVQVLSHKLEYHAQIAKAYDILEKFENTTNESQSQPSAKVLSHWAAEGMAWASTQAQVVTGFEENNDPSKTRKRLLFAEFAGACAFPEVRERPRHPSRIYFSESTRTRRDALEYVFRPLCGDVFSFNVVYSVFDSLGIREDCKYIEKCFGEWFMTLPIEECYQKGLQSENPPMTRLLQDLVTRQLVRDNLDENEAGLSVLHSFCTESDDLVRSFILCVLCLEAVQRAATQKEKRTYGKISSAKMTERWACLLRKLRVCLLVSFRMHGVRLAAPITVANIDDPKLFSVYEWLARDELSVSIHQDEVALLENACIMSSHGFDPSLPEGDGPAKFKVLQGSCLAAVISEEERAEYLVDIDRYGILLLFLMSFRNQTLLAAHRALLLGADFGANPDRLELMEACIEALKYFEGTHPALASAVCFEVWQSQLCPIYRAHLFGFADVQEVSEDVIGPLLQTAPWLVAVGRMGLRLLEILKKCSQSKVEEEDLLEPQPPVDRKSWPAVRRDCVLQRVRKKLTRKIDKMSLDAHSVVVCALLVSGDIKALVQCVPDIYGMFQSTSLFHPIATSSDVPELQQNYLMEAIVNFACLYDGEPMEQFDLLEIEAIANVWGLDMKTVRVHFLRAMYELGKDKKVDPLLSTIAASMIDVAMFVDAGVDIVCHRLDTFLGSRQARNLLSLLDAEVCAWIHQRKVKAPPPLVDQPDWHTSIGNTHLLIMRLLSLSAGANIETPARTKIHSLVVMSGILVKSLVDTSTTIS